MEFYDEIGKMAIGSRLRRLSDLLTEEAAQIYALFDVDLQPKWFPVFYVLSRGEERTITEIAQEIGHSHPSVSQIVREMAKKGYVKEKKGKKDGRKNFITLSATGEAIRTKIQDQYADVGAAVNTAMQTTQYDLWKAIAEWEFLLEQKSLLRRVQEEKKKRESGTVQIVDYTSKHASAFKQLNEAWITQYFTMEREDHKALDHPKEYILQKGGHILMAIHDGQPVGTCALIKMEDGDGYELAKMAVAPEARGKSIGWLLGRAAIERARSNGARRVYLESNTILKPAINLYHKLGFKKITGPPSPYERANIQMELRLDEVNS
jgi:GNAT superfamily N-acetyltransferase/predicted transcriptional regulator